MLRRQDKDRRWRANYKRLEREVNSIEEDEYQLERVYPQVCVWRGGRTEAVECGQRKLTRFGTDG